MTTISFKEAERLLTGRIMGVYGISQGKKAAGVLLPAIFKDFRGLLKSHEGEESSETYRSEDRKAEIILTGIRRDGKTALTHISFNGQTIC
ncbi:hypothetical protein ACKX2L_07200 [Lachnospiraceae bacterium YH-ros2228]|nr:hypothetical protein [Lachnospiraceae bacterium]